jgi:putative ABC transport system permease protein
MSEPVQTIPLANLAIAFVPVAATLIVLFRWSVEPRQALYSVLRMLLQLALIGYFLKAIFDADHSAIILVLLLMMVFFSSWIALGTVKNQRSKLFLQAFAAIALGGGITLALITQGVLQLSPWFEPEKMIPLAGMVFANAMNAVSLAAERMQTETERGLDYHPARKQAMQAAMIPLVNSLFAVGLVSLPGMMTGQILSGVSPLIAARYQIMVMCMVFGASGISAACFLVWSRGIFSTHTPSNSQ